MHYEDAYGPLRGRALKQSEVTTRIEEPKGKENQHGKGKERNKKTFLRAVNLPFVAKRPDERRRIEQYPEDH